MRKLLQRLPESAQIFLQDEQAQSLIEYVLIGVIIALGAIAGMGTLASKINVEFSKIAGDLT